MKNQLMRIVLAVALIGSLVGAAAIVSADANENTTADDDAGTMDQIASHMSDHTPGDHHADHAEHHQSGDTAE